ncbi:MAG: cytochrome ubiquinol oxidase subunit I, partial [Bacteroidota bacterium]|nr:cytochrome ubiquinol oxidase subunit I [Bacteroidota bacterium]
RKGADLVIGGIPDDESEKVYYAIKIPGGLSFLAHGDFDAEVIGLDKFAKEDRPPVAITHYAFQVMVGLGMALVLVGLIFLIGSWKKKQWITSRWFLRMVALATPMGFIALEAGWVVTEVGRQPWIIYGIMRTKDAVTPMPGIQYSFYIFTFVYISLSFVVILLLTRQIKVVPKIYEKHSVNHIEKEGH